MAPASKRLVSKKLDVADVKTNFTRRSVLSRKKSPDLEDLFAEHHYDSEKGHYTQARNDGSTTWSDSDNRKETASSETRGSKEVEDSDTSEDEMCDVSSPLMRRMSCPPAEGYSPERHRSCSSSPGNFSGDAHSMRRMGCQGGSGGGHPMRRMGCTDGRAGGQPMRRMGCTEEADDSLLDLSPPAHAFLTLPSNKSADVSSLQEGRGMRRHPSGFVASPAKRSKKTSHVTVARLQARFRPLRDQEQSYKSPTRILTTEVLELSSDDSPVRKATPPTKFRAKDLRVDVPDDDISWLQRTPLTQDITSASSPLPLLDLSPITMLGEGSLFLGQTSASPVRPRRLSFSPSSDGSADFFKALSGSHHGSTSAPVSARRDQSERNTNSQGGLQYVPEICQQHNHNEDLVPRLSRDERSVFLDSRYSGGRQSRKYMLRSGVVVCRRAFIRIFCVGESKLVMNTPCVAWGTDRHVLNTPCVAWGTDRHVLNIPCVAWAADRHVLSSPCVAWAAERHLLSTPCVAWAAHRPVVQAQISVALRGKKAFTMPQMQQVIQEAYVPSPVFEVLEETWDFKTIVQSRPSPVLPLHDVTFNQQFKIALGGDNWPRLWTKKFSTDETWEPTGGVRHLVLIPDVISDITAAPLVAFKSHSHKHDKIEDLSADALESFAKIKKDIQNVCFSFFSEAERNWWHNWFMRQKNVAADTQSGRQIKLMRQWRWRSPLDEDISRSKQPPTVITSGDLAQRILGERRPAYAGTRRARPGTSEHDRIHHICDIKDLASGHVVAVLAEDDKSFWVSKVIDIKSTIVDGEPNEVEI
ncbi:hypothetical protein R1sor_005742 [Riccia sorocarpa]|uniref:DUF7869 domain-containing protein n=1 Tax=Riccia sorocarpa TaxID=122646 RepID=A0ABD3HMS2_9MARC